MKTLYESILDNDEKIESSNLKTLESYEIFKEFTTRLFKVLKQHELKIDGNTAIFKGKTQATSSQYKTTVEQWMRVIASKISSKRKLYFDDYGNDFRFFERNKNQAFMSIEYLFINSSLTDKKIDRLQLKFTPLS